MESLEPKIQQNENNNSQEPNIINNNPIHNSQPSIPQVTQPVQEGLDQDELANLRYHDENNLNNNQYFHMQRLDSNGSPIAAQFKFSIDMPNVSKQRLHEFLNDDLLNALDVSPNLTPVKPNEIPSNEPQIPPNPNENNLYGFSLYPSKVNDNIEQKNDINIQNQSNNNNKNSNMLNIEEPIYIPKNLRDINQAINVNNSNIQNKEDIKQKNKFDVSKKAHNSMKFSNKENNKNKKAFEVRLGDWTCSKCSNLNFAFRNKCNRCGMLKTVSEQQKMNIISQLNLNNYPMYMNMPPIMNNNEQEHF